MAPLHAQSSPGPAATQTMQHFTHPNHPLHKVYMATEYKCDGCNTLGFGTRHRCAACDFDLHEHCATCPFTFPSPLHPQHQLTLVNQPGGNAHFCDLCGEFVNGLFYTCRACNFDVHPLCTQLPSHVRHALHPQHPLTLQLENPGWCDLCRRKCTSWRYRCSACDVDLHPKCVAGGPPAMCVPPPSGYGGGYPPGPGGVPSSGGFRMNGSNSTQIYSVVGKLAAKAVLGSMFGVSPTG